MKALRTLLLILTNILLIPLAIIITVGAVWYSLPAIQTTFIGDFLLTTLHLTNTSIFWITIGSLIGYIVILILQKIFNKTLSARFKNFFTHLNTWLIALIAIALAITTFVLAPVATKALEFTTIRKIGMGVIITLLLIFHIVSTKLSRIINRKIQAYEDAKEMNVVGRSSVIWVNILKLIEILFPEILVLALLCYCVSWNVATYFLIIVIACLIPMLGNIECDFVIRREIKKKNELEKDLLAEKVANNIKGE